MAAIYAAHGAGHNTQASLPAGSGPPGTFAPGTKVQVGTHRVVIEKYLSEGGFAHVYVVRVPRGDNKHEVAVLKRVAVPDKEALANMRTEVETMKKLQGHTRIVKYIDSHASQLKGGGYEVFLLMEYCAGGGLIDFMNTRLQYRLTEPEILHIISDVAEGVATMHYLKPPLLHRDLKVENVLISKPSPSSSNMTYKLCDFGSTAPPRPAATNAKEARLIEDDVQRHTTMQYRSPEMIDVWRKQPIDEKSDIWALGVLLYKLCYYTTPFEEVGQMAILNAKFKFPHHPHFTERMRRLISVMLKEDPKQRPNIFQVLEEICDMRGKPVPIKNIYSSRTKSEDRRNQKLPPTSPQVASPPPAVGISHSSPQKVKETLPDITPMRRGRPLAPSSQPASTKPSPSPGNVKGDPFAALDSSNFNVRAGAVDQLSKKFPSLDEFTIATNERGDFKFGSQVSSTAVDKARGLGSAAADRSRSTASSVNAGSLDSQSTSKRKDLNLPGEQSEFAGSLPPTRSTTSRSSYVSTGTMTSASPKVNPYKVSTQPIWRVPEQNGSDNRFSTKVQAPDDSRDDIALETNETSRSMGDHNDTSRASADRPSSPDEDSLAVGQTPSTSKPRPVSSSFSRSNLDYLREHEISASRSPPALGCRRSSRQNLSGLASPAEQAPIKSDTAYLQSLEDSDDTWEVEQLNKMSLRSKRASMPPVKLSEGKTSLFDRTAPQDGTKQNSRQSDSRRARDVRRPLSPVAPSENTSDGPSLPLTNTGGEITSADQRREIEKQQALDEERRVAAAAEAYRQRSGGAQTAPPRSNTIQQRMQSLLDDGRSSAVKRTAAGYGPYTDAEDQESGSGMKRIPPSNVQLISPSDYSRRPESPKVQQDLSVRKLRTQPVNAPASSTTPSSSDRRASLKPLAKPKPVGLRSGFTGPRSAASPATGKSPSEATAEWQSAATSSSQGSRLAALLAKDQEGAAEAGSGSGSRSKRNGMVIADSDELQQALEVLPDEAVLGDASDWQMEFSKRYPSLSGIELVETEISSAAPTEIRIRDV